MRPTEKPRTDGATPERLAELWAETEGDTLAIAERFGVSARTVRRWIVGWGIDQPRPRMPYLDGVPPGVIQDLADGMPAGWAIEGTDHNHRSFSKWLAKRFPQRSRELREWFAIWPSILHNPTMRALHDEFAPRTKVTL